MFIFTNPPSPESVWFVHLWKCWLWTYLLILGKKKLNGLPVYFSFMDGTVKLDCSLTLLAYWMGGGYMVYPG